MTVIEQIISLVAPHYCLSCDNVGAIICAECLPKMPASRSQCYACQSVTVDFKTCQKCINGGIIQVFGVTPYDDLGKKLVHKLKFGRAKEASKVMAERISMAVPDNNWLIIPIPTATNRVRQRGYDQAYLIAKYLAAYKKCQIAPVLLKIGQNRQVGKKREQRLDQMANSFGLKRSSKLDLTGRRILLVDDVITTGATLEAASKVLKKAGADQICGAVFAVA